MLQSRAPFSSAPHPKRTLATLAISVQNYRRIGVQFFFLTLVQKLSYFVRMLEDLKLGKGYDGFLFLAESIRNPPKLESHHHIELELNLVVRGTITYVVGGRRFAFQPRSLLWLDRIMRRIMWRFLNPPSSPGPAAPMLMKV